MNADTIRRAMRGDREAQEACTRGKWLLPCPFCGNAEVDIYTGRDMQYHRRCLSCGAEAVCDTPMEALTAWNTRAGMDISQGWIPCAERLPEYGVNILVYDKFEGVQFGFIRNDNVVGWLYRECEFMSCDVTHWMPLPERPGEK